MGNLGRSLYLKYLQKLNPMLFLFIVTIVPLFFIATFYPIGLTERLALVAVALALASVSFQYVSDFYGRDALSSYVWTANALGVVSRNGVACRWMIGK